MKPCETIVVIEDNEEDFSMITYGLAQAGASPSIAHLPHTKAVNSWLEEKRQPANLIIMDLNIPGESGVALIRKFRAHPSHQLTPIVVLSTSHNPRDIEASYQAGANTYHVKPLETPRFHELVSNIAVYWIRDAVRAEHF